MPNSSKPPINFHLDHPGDWNAIPRQLTIRGWVFWAGHGETLGVRALIDGRFVLAALGFHRPDVPAVFPQAPGEFTGYQIATPAPRGKFTVELQMRTASADWQTFFATSARSSRWRRPFALGGGSSADLLATQLSLIPQYAARPIRPEQFPTIPAESTALPKLCIVTPSFNQGQWLEQCIRSVTAGSEPGIRHFVQDGGSTDNSVDVLESHSGKLHSWVSKPDGGQADAIALAFAETSGSDDDLMAWINADDHYLPGTLSFVRRYFLRHPEVDVLYGNRVLIDDAGLEIGRWHLPPHDDEVLRLYDFVPQETLFWRRRIWQKVGGVDPSLQFALDWDLLLRFQAAGANIVHLPRFLAVFRIHAGQKSAAIIGSVGQKEIDQLRQRTFGRDLTPEELVQAPVLEAYLRQSARRELAAKFGWRPHISV